MNGFWGFALMMLGIAALPLAGYMFARALEELDR